MARSLQDPRYRAVVERLVEIRHELGIGQRELAERLGKARSFVSKVETFEIRLDVIQLLDWHRALEGNEPAFLSDVAQIARKKRK